MTKKLPPNVIAFPRRRRPRTLGELVDSVERVPNTQVNAALVDHMTTLQRLLLANGKSRAPMIRELATVGTLVSRALFQNMGVPVDPNFVIEAR